MFATHEQENRELRDHMSSLQTSIAALVDDVNSLRTLRAKELESSGDKAAEVQATAVAETETLAVHESAATGMSETIHKGESAACAEQGESSFKVAKEDSVATTEDTKLSDRVGHLESSFQKLELLMGTTESKLRLAAEVPECQQSILLLQKSVAELSQIVQEAETKAACRGGVSESTEAVTVTDSAVAAGVNNVAITEEPAALPAALEGVEHFEEKPEAAEVSKARESS